MLKKIAIFLLFPSVILFASTWTQTSDSDFSSGEFSSAETSGSGSAANLQLQTASSLQFGNCLRVEGNSNFSLSNINYRYSIRFTAQNTNTSVLTIHLCVYRGGIRLHIT